MAKRRTWTVSALAQEAELDVEQVLVALWGESIEYPMQANSRVRTEDSVIAERAVGMGGSRQKRVGYWLDDEMSDREVSTFAGLIARRSHVIRREDRAVTWR